MDAVTIGGVGTVANGDADGFDGASGLRITARPAAQVQNVIDSSAPFVQNRGNITFDVSFSSSKRFASAEDAEEFCGNHARAVAGATSFGGFGISLVSAICSVECSMIGLVVERSYKITGAEGA